MTKPIVELAPVISEDTELPAMDDFLESMLTEMQKLPYPPLHYHSGIRRTRLPFPDNVVVWADPFRTRPTPISLHSRYLLAIAIRSAGTILLEDRPFLLWPGQALLIFPHQQHRFGDFSRSEASWLLVGFDLSGEGDIHQLRDTAMILTPEARAVTRQLLRVYHQSLRSLSASNRVQLHLADLLILMMQGGSEDLLLGDEAAQDRWLIEQVSAYVQNHLHEPFGIDAIAEHLGYSESYLRARFRGATGRSLGGYIATRRLSKATALLTFSGMSVGQIAEVCGFASQSAFSRTFRKHARVTPSAFRRSARQAASRDLDFRWEASQGDDAS